MAVIPYLSQGQGVPIDPITGLPKKRQTGGTSSAPNFLSGGFVPNPMAGYSPSAPAPAPLPDFRALIANDPSFQQFKTDASSQGISDAAQRAAATQRALVQFGEVPQFNQLAGLNQEFLNQDVNDTTRQLAQQNTQSGLSVVARQQRQFQDAVRQIRNALASRGALRSGEAQFQLQRAQQGFDEARYDTTQQLLDYLGQFQRGFAEGERQRQRQIAEQATAAEERQRAQYVAPAPPPTPAPPPEPEPQISEELRRVLGGLAGPDNASLFYAI